MTRFARAKGSKSSNAREAENATGWSEFKRQIGEKKPETDKNTTVSVAQSVLKRFKEGQHTDSGWADFGTTVRQNQSGKVSKKRKISGSDASEQAEVKKKVKKFDKKDAIETGDDAQQPDSAAQDSQVEGIQVSKKKPNKFKKKDGFTNGKDSVSLNSESGEVGKDNETQSQSKRNNRFSESAGLKGKKDFKRRKPYVESSTLNINGFTISISKFDGFDVKSDDAVRLRELKSKMLKEGIPRVEVDSAIKLERRKAEKALTREKKKVCFNCRRGGHLLSECPDVGSSFGSKNFDTSAITMCYKCGSTEHTHYQCQVKKQKEYSFATCFICKEQGHISSQCPDNPRGLYPQGGSCKVCGEVTHLKKDCPQLSKEKTENTLTLDTLTSASNPESLGDDVEAPKVKKLPAAKQNKIIKF